MDKRSIIGFVVIFAIILIFSKYVLPPSPQRSVPTETDTTGVVQQMDTLSKDIEETPAEFFALTEADTAKMAEMTTVDEEPEKEIIIETGLLKILLSSRGRKKRLS
jgi:hypothetical protein